MLDQMVGSMIASFYVYYVFVPNAQVMWTFIFLPGTLVYPIERIIGASIAALIVFTVSRTVGQTYFNLSSTPFQATGFLELTDEQSTSSK
jgi:hypothetical protein